MKFLSILFMLPAIILGSEGLETSYAPQNTSLNEQKPYERLISLGNCCVTRTQINHHLISRFAVSLDRFGGGQLFDWLVIHDYNKLSEAIKNNLIDLFEKSDLQVVKMSKSYNVRNLKYHMTWNHLFTRISKTQIRSDIIELEYELRKQKIDYLSGKFRSLGQYRTLYIVTYPFIDAGPLGTIEPNLETLVRLRNSLTQIRGNQNFTLLFCPLVKKFEDFENIQVRTIPAANVLPWEGDYIFWNAFLSQYPITIDPITIEKTLEERQVDQIF